jgi:RNA polymerase sigma factor (sigma-70 family)
LIAVLDAATTHQHLITQCKAGNRQAQFALYQLYAKAMYNVALRMVRHAADAEDVLQNAFVEVFMKLDSFRQESTIGAWIKRIVVNHCINFLKKRKPDLVAADDHWPDYPDTDDHASAEEQLTLRVEKINQAIALLPDGYRVVFSLYLMEGYDHQEIAGILNISEATSKSQYHRAKSKIRTILTQL